MCNITSKYVGYYHLLSALFLMELQKNNFLYWKLLATMYMCLYFITICRCAKIHWNIAKKTPINKFVVDTLIKFV